MRVANDAGRGSGSSGEVGAGHYTDCGTGSASTHCWSWDCYDTECPGGKFQCPEGTQERFANDAVRGCVAVPIGVGEVQETPADRVPPAQAELGLRWQPLQKLGVSRASRGRLKQDRLNDPVNLEDNRIPEGGTPGYVTHHLLVGDAAFQHAMVRLVLDHLTDQLVLEHGSGLYRPGFCATASLDLAMP